MQLNRTADLEFIQIQSPEQNPWMSKQFAFVKDTWVLSSFNIKKKIHSKYSEFRLITRETSHSVLETTPKKIII